VEDEPGKEHELFGYRTDCRPRKELLKRADRGRMDQQLADVRRHLNKEDPAVVVPQHEQEGLEEARKAFDGFIAAVAACRRRAIGTNLILLPLHNPVEIAEIGAFMWI